MRQFIKTAMIFMVLVALMLSLSGCTSPTVTPSATPTPTPEPQGPVVLTITGKVDKTLSLTMADLLKYENKSASVTNKNNTTESFTGPSLNKILDAAGLKSDATTLRFIGSDGYNKTINVTDVRASADALISIGSDGTLKNIVPGQPKNTYVGKLVRIEVE